MSDITYCIRGCTRLNAAKERIPVTTDTPAQLCRNCIDRLTKWVTEIPDRYALLPRYLLPSTDIDANPETTTTKNPVAPTPIRVNILDLLDERRGRKWLGLEPTKDRRGTLGILHAWANEIRDERDTDTRLKESVSREAATIKRHLQWAAAQPWISDMYSELRILHRELGNAIGEYPPKPIGICEVIDPNTDDPTECGGPLLPSYTGVYCPACNTNWNQDELRRLGMILGEKATA